MNNLKHSRLLTGLILKVLASQAVLVRYPDLKVVVPHCGSFLPNALPRFKGLLPVMVKQGYMKPVDVDANISHLYFDLAGAKKALEGRLAAHGLVQEEILSNNAKTLFNIQ